eukprot:TRINITY_DN2329_c0_g1_i1.p1 TRINITY_DN2329_c0_g1~~TRINITY_DN2329_c0_g1_i1.p1  ORF type:complete len:123 (-),score=18.38 TRINITY_DN2329_c0_g1_i1:96-464(-)
MVMLARLLFLFCSVSTILANCSTVCDETQCCDSCINPRTYQMTINCRSKVPKAPSISSSTETEKQTADKTNGSNAGLVIGLAVGGTIFVCCVAGIIGFCCWKRHKTAQCVPVPSQVVTNTVG